MKSSQVTKGKETQELKQLYENLQHEWETFKQCNLCPTKPSSKYSTSPSNNASFIKAIIQLQNNSPRYLMSMLQQDYYSSSSTSEAWMMMRTNDVAAQDTLQERWEGRQLFVPTEECDCEMSDMSAHCEEVRSVVSFCYSEEEHKYSSGSKGHCSRECCHSSSSVSSSSSSSSSPCYLLGANSVDKDRVVSTVAAETGVASRGRYGILFGGLAFALLLVTISCMTGGWYYQVILVPT